MPGSVILSVAASWVGTAVAATNLAAVASFTLGVSLGTIASAVSMTAMAIVGSAMARRQEKKAAAAAKAQTIANIKDVQAVVRSAIQPQNIIYGRSLVGGMIPFWFISGDVGQYHHWAQTIAGHEIDGVDAYYIGDELVTVDGSGWVTTPKFCRGGTEPLIRIRVYDGTQTTLDADLLAASGGALTSADSGRGVSYLAVRWEADYDVFGQTGAPVIRPVVRGKKLYDPRTGLTTFSDNAALATRDYLTSYLGLRCSAAEVNDDDVIAAANVCDELVAIGGAENQARYTVNGVITCGSNLKDNLEVLADAMAGIVVWTQGQWSVQAGAWQVPVADIGVNDIIAVEDLVAYTPRRELFNTVTGTYIEPGDLYAEKQFPIVTNAAYVAADAGQIIERDLAMPMCNNGIRAQRMAKIEMERARQAVTVALMCKWTAYDLRPGSHVTVTIPRYGWAGKTFFVADRTLSADGIRYVLRETAPEVWEWNFGEATTVDLAPNTALPNPFVVSVISGLSAQSGTSALQIAGDGTVISRIRLSWDAVSDVYVQASGRIEINYRPQGATDWATARSDGSETATYLGPVEDGIVYQLRARAVNNIGQRGAWSEITHTVVGKTEPPPSISAFTINGTTLNWTPLVDVPDLAGYVVRFQYGNKPWWPTAAPLHDGVLTETPWVMTTKPAGQITLMVKAVDTSGNESLSPAIIVTNLGDPLVNNVLLSWPQAPTWSGTAVGGSVISEALQADETDSLYGPPNEAFYGSSASSFYSTTTYADMSYEFNITPSAEGSLTLLYQLTGQGYTIEYRRDNQDTIFGADEDFFYGPDEDPIYGDPLPWTTWPGGLTLPAPERIDFRVQVVGGTLRGIIHVLTANLDVPDVQETIADAVIPAGGSRLLITETYRSIVGVQITLQDDGNGGRSVLVQDKNPELGPYVVVLNSSGTSVQGLIDADIQGY